MSHAETNKDAAACNAQFPGQLTGVEFEASLSNSLQHSLHISGLKHEAMPGNCGAQARCFRNFTDRFREGSYFFQYIYLVIPHK